MGAAPTHRRDRDRFEHGEDVLAVAGERERRDVRAHPAQPDHSLVDTSAARGLEAEQHALLELRRSLSSDGQGQRASEEPARQ